MKFFIIIVKYLSSDDSLSAAMEQGTLTREADSGGERMRTLILDSPEALGALNNPLRTRMLELLYHTPRYPAELAKELHMHEQKVYYHIKQLLNAGFLVEEERKEIRGTVAKRYRTSALAYSIVLSQEWEAAREGMREGPKEARWFFSPFLDGDRLSGAIVVGSPDPHGRYKSYARDGHYAVELSLFLGNIAGMPEDFGVLLDVDVKKEKRYDADMILIGGPITNSITEEINGKLPVTFLENPTGIESRRSGKRYFNETVGVVECVKSPFAPSRHILLIAGVRAIGTKSAILALTREKNLIQKAYTAKNREFSLVVEGFDLDGDGKVDSIEILE